MELTNTQAYFYIFCKWMTIAFIAKLAYNLIKIHILSSGYACKGLKRLSDEVTRAKHMAYEAYLKTIDKSTTEAYGFGAPADAKESKEL